LRPLEPGLDPHAVFAALRSGTSPGLLLDGGGAHADAWQATVAIEPAVLAMAERAEDVSAAVREVDARVARRRLQGGAGGTGVALVVAYEALDPRPQRDAPWAVVALEVDAAVRWKGAEPVFVGLASVLETARPRLEGAARERLAPPGLPPRSGRPMTSLGRERYLRAVGRIRRHIARGDIYQANLTQRFAVPFAGDPWELYRTLAAATPAPRSAFVDVGGTALASVSPEIFVDVDREGRAATLPIKGTRARHQDPEADEAAARELLTSEKDRAELTMIVDLERNDLGRIARPGSVRVLDLASLRSYPAVHHLVARVEAHLREGIGIAALLDAAFPGGSITGAPKIRAMRILSELEPVPRGLYTGSLFWLDDDGSTASSILIRSAVVTHGEVRIGAGGGIVADSDPEDEWMESNAKARALTRALGFEPEEAS
jgi:anthranilate/para-aminobenzoate synthase component I